MTAQLENYTTEQWFKCTTANLYNCMTAQLHNCTTLELHNCTISSRGDLTLECDEDAERYQLKIEESLQVRHRNNSFTEIDLWYY